MNSSSSSEASSSSSSETSSLINSKNHLQLQSSSSSLSSSPSSFNSDDGLVTDRSYSKAFLIGDIIWNMLFVFVSLGVLVLSLGEKPSTPLRVWISGYDFMCVLHVVLVRLEFSRKIDRGGDDDDGFECSSLESSWCENGDSSIFMKLETVNSVAASVWSVLGFYWVCAGGRALVQDSPRLYRLAVAFIVYDACVVILFTGMICVICLALICCIPIVAIAYAMTMREGATEDDIRLLPKYKFHQHYTSRMSSWDLNQESGQTIGSESRNCVNEPLIHPQDSECCICLVQYVEGAELCTLPCNHHFHFGCISRWLRINATCPLCKFNILRRDTLV